MNHYELIEVKTENVVCVIGASDIVDACQTARTLTASSGIGRYRLRRCSYAKG